MAWTWQLESSADENESSPGRSALAEIENPVHPSQSDAESWVGEVWPQLAEQGVTQVTLFHDGNFVYGPMLLSE
ncbi:hypothetical protein SAMN05444157_1897 [Frankineae bacterium MT45]|nr:hypothetical protein SAMN05444157_1897 [Frankineae bacterium MT45]